MSKTIPEDLIIYHQTSNSFHGIYKDSIISMESAIHSDDDGLFYILVTDKDGTYSYDGWSPKSVRTITGAIFEAIDGAQL